MATNFLKSYEHPSIVVIDPGEGVTAAAVINANSLSLEAEGQIIESGFFAATVNGADRILPRTTLSAVTATDSTEIDVDFAKVFVPGDILEVVEPFGILTPTSYTAGTTYNFIVNGAKARVAIPATPAVDIGVFIADAINKSAISRFVNAISNSPTFDTIWVFANDGISTLTLQSEDVASVGTFIEDTTIAKAADPIGTIQSIDITNNKIFLTANAAAVYEQGVKVGVAIERPLGLLVEEYSLRQRPFVNVTLTTCSKLVYSNRLPYLDGSIKQAFTNLNFSVDQ